MKPPLDNQASVESSLEALKSQLKQLEVRYPLAFLSAFHQQSSKAGVGVGFIWAHAFRGCNLWSLSPVTSGFVARQFFTSV